MRPLLLIVVLVLAACAADPAPASPPPAPDSPYSLSVPPYDRVAWAAAIYGPRTPEATRAAPPAPGARESFAVANSAARHVRQVTAELRAAGQYVYVWIEVGSNVSTASAQAFAAAFDRLAAAVLELWDTALTPGPDGLAAVHTLFTTAVAPGTSAFYSSLHNAPPGLLANSNARHLLTFNLSHSGPQLDRPHVLTLAAHELQHLLRDLLGGQESWLDEGLSSFTELYLGYTGVLAQARAFLEAPDTQLNAWPPGAPRDPHYGASLLFVSYLYQHCGPEGLRALPPAAAARGLEAVQSVLDGCGLGTVNEFFADWVTANTMPDDSQYGYGPPLSGLEAAAPLATVRSYPYLASGQVPQYAAVYYVLEALEERPALLLNLSLPPAVPLLPLQAAVGLWATMPADRGAATLTQSFDLSGLDSADLVYRVWFDIEAGWDYAYLLASSDGGTNWQPLFAPGMETENPFGQAHGPAYTGYSGGWLDETVSLDAYAGGQLLLRFALLTDDAVIGPGLALDDVALPQAVYSSSFDEDRGGWLAEGWLWTDNRLPQEGWLIAVQFTPDGPQVTRMAAAGGPRLLSLLPGVERVVLIFAPYAPLTTQPVPYTLVVADPPCDVIEC